MPPCIPALNTILPQKGEVRNFMLLRKCTPETKNRTRSALWSRKSSTRHPSERFIQFGQHPMISRPRVTLARRSRDCHFGCIGAHPANPSVHHGIDARPPEGTNPHLPSRHRRNACHRRTGCSALSRRVGPQAGFVGVDVFFVISGFLITSPLEVILAATRRIDLAAFYTRRARHLLPALSVAQVADATRSSPPMSDPGSVAERDLPANMDRRHNLSIRYDPTICLTKQSVLSAERPPRGWPSGAIRTR